VKGYYYNIDI